MTSSPDINTTAASQKLVSFLLDVDDVLQCEICKEAFDSQLRPPKLLPCGHNFCDNCLFLLCLHQELNLEDVISCPTCRAKFRHNIAMNAPTNYDLCKMLDNVKRGQDMNVTVIHVADKSCSSPCSKVNYAVETGTPPTKLKMVRQKRENRRVAKRSNSDKKGFVDGHSLEKDGSVSKRKLENINRCVDCNRRIGLSNRCKMSRFCQQCHGSDKVLHLSCLECWVNKHNGHSLRSVEDLEYEHLKLLNELRELELERRNLSGRFDSGLKLLQVESNINLDFCSLSRAKQTLMKESDKSYAKSISRLEDAFSTPLPPTVITKIRHRELHNFSRLRKMLNLVEKCHQNVQTRLDRHMEMLTNSLPNSVSTSSHRSVSTVKADEGATYSSLSTVLTLAKDSIADHHVIKKSLPIIMDENLPVQPKINALKQCIAVINQVLNNELLPEILLLFQDAYLNCFHSLHFYSKKLGDPDERKNVWALVQISMTELLRIASIHFTNFNADRVDIVGDIAFLCHLFSDVCDNATMALCLIEAARSRMTHEQAESSTDRERIEVQLKLIDEHLTECRRVQKLRELRSDTVPKGKGRYSRIRRWFKSTLSSHRVSAN